jgi:hypothetical protein
MARIDRPVDASGVARVPVVAGALDLSGAAVDSQVRAPSPAARPVCTTVRTSAHQTPLAGYVQANGSVHAKVSVREEVRTSQELGISVSVDGGAYKASGEASIEVRGSSADTTAAAGTSQLWKNRVNYYRFKTTCNNGYVALKWRPTSLYNLNEDFDVVTHPIYPTCGWKPAGGQFTKSTGATYKYASGVELTPVKVSAKAEWGKDVDLTWTPTRRVRYCGTSKDGPDRSALVEVHLG